MVGAGVAGLAAAHRLLARPARDVEVVLYEAGPRAGGPIGTEHVDGFAIELGPDTFITDKPWALALCERLGFADALIATRPGERRTWVVRDGRLAPLPEGFLMMAPTAPWPLVTSPLFSWAGKLRMALDLILPAHPVRDESLGAFVRRRLGREALERVVDPLVSGIYTADPDRLSLAATMPRFQEMERVHGSVIHGLRHAADARDAAGARYGLFASHRDGMGGLVDALVARLPPGALHLRTPVRGLEPGVAGWRVHLADAVVETDAVIVAVPAWAAAPLLAPLDASLAADLAAIDYASSATVTFAVRAGPVRDALRGFGFVVPFAEGRRLVACTFASRKWAGRAPDGYELLRAFVGGARDPGIVDADDATLVATARGELEALLRVPIEPVLTRVARHRRAMPQYAVGHLDRVAALEARLATLPGLALAGAAYRGVGIPDCVRSGEAAADALGFR
ncbi:MAG: protoporphyrinogen oxidase [bacterium]|nr:protoporphyrinogen oxidase [bacterium]